MSAVVGAAVLCAGAAAWLTVGGRDGVLRRARGLAGVVVPGPAAVGARWRRGLAVVRDRLRPELWCAIGGLVVAFLGESLVPLAVGVLGTPVVGRARKAGWVRRERERRADQVIAVCGALAGEVRAGRQPGEALCDVAGDGFGAARGAVLAAARFGGDVPGALRAAGREPGAEGLLGLAACWRVAVDRGAGLAAGLERLEEVLRTERDQRSDFRAQLAGARSTAVLLAGLPVMGLLMGTALGADPLRVLLHTGAGLGCLAVGAALEGVGVWWAVRIMRGAEER
ncbi:type II secretion system F family protein [Actinomycetota bacterium Odt1-20B]